MNESWDLPSDELLGSVMERLSPASVLEVCRQRLCATRNDSRQAWREARMIEALYHPGRYVRVAYALVSDSSLPAQRNWPEADIVYFHSPVRKPMSRRGTLVRLEPGRSQGGAKDAEVEVYRFPNDRRLRGLRKFAGCRDAVRVWQNWLDETESSCDLDASTMQRLLVRYVPEQKWIVRLRAETIERGSGVRSKRRIAVRCGSAESCAALLSRHLALTLAGRGAAAAFHVPTVVGADIDKGILAVEWNRGLSLVETLRNGAAGDEGDSSDVAEVMQGMAASVASLHSAPVEGLRCIGSGDIASAAQAAAADLSLASPKLQERLQAIVQELTRRLRTLESPADVTLHNDLHWNQVRIKRGRFMLLDLERLARGDAMIDVANFTTQVRMLAARVEQDIHPDVAGGWADEFLDQWSRVTGAAVDQERFRVYAVWSLINLAQGMMRHLREGWRALADRCIESAERVLASSAPVLDPLTAGALGAGRKNPHTTRPCGAEEVSPR
ncbi:MAG: phosphotransferase family protein [Phycisphaerae bacterium]